MRKGKLTQAKRKRSSKLTVPASNRRRHLGVLAVTVSTQRVACSISLSIFPPFGVRRIERSSVGLRVFRGCLGFILNKMTFLRIDFMVTILNTLVKKKK